jgi:hypothetical protein
MKTIYTKNASGPVTIQVSYFSYCDNKRICLRVIDMLAVVYAYPTIAQAKQMVKALNEAIERAGK